MHDSIELAVTVAALAAVTACLPPDASTAPRKPRTNADVAALVHTWAVADHVMIAGAPITDEDARVFHGRDVEVTSTGYTTPWHGSCEDAGRTRRARDANDVVFELDLEATARARIISFGLEGEVLEFRLDCTDRQTTPSLLLYVHDTKAMTCFGGACYLATRQ